jgi:ABC-type nickel/cobalt efflux system permease component RcnA
MGEEMRKFVDGLSDLVILLFVVLGTAVVMFEIFPSLTSEAAAAWTQAGGAMIAIGIAIWVPIDQNKKSQERDAMRERTEIAHDLQSLREELSVMSEGMKYSIGNIMDRDLPNGIIPVTWRPEVDAYVIYNSICERIGRVPDQNLRRGIIRTYARLKGVVLSFRLNADLLEQLQQAEVERNEKPTSEYYTRNYERAHSRLHNLAKGLQQAYRETMSDVEGLMLEIDKALVKMGH